MRTLYHFHHSPFSRRTRLALAHKGLDAQLRECREDPSALEEARRLAPLRTIPLLVDGERALGDSTAITRWLDATYPQAPRLWPGGDEAADVLETTTLVDVLLNNVVDVATRYYALHGDPAWEGVKAEQVGRARLAADALARRATTLGTGTIAKSGWSVADMWLLAAVLWFEGLPARAAGNKNVTQLLTLGVELPAALTAWAASHRERPEVKALYGAAR